MRKSASMQGVWFDSGVMCMYLNVLVVVLDGLDGIARRKCDRSYQRSVEIDLLLSIVLCAALFPLCRCEQWESVV